MLLCIQQLSYVWFRIDWPISIFMNIQKLGRYEITGELGRGAMGVVYKAIDPLIERTVAIKTISLDLSKDELAIFEERFYREAKSAGKLNHPNIVTIYDVGESDNIAYIAMEFLEGQSLRELLDSGVVLPLERIGEIAVQVAEGLAYAQENDIVHRDIKPANIVITKTGVAKITDFGIAHMPSGARTMAGMVMGSPKYMSPEQVIGKSVDGRSDIFSLGAVVYEMLTGVSPVDGDNISAIMYRILNEMPAPPHTLNSSIPEAFDWIIAKALAKHPDDRYQTAREFADDIRRHKNLLKPIGYVQAHGTLERRKMPRTNVGDTTLLLQRMSSGEHTSISMPQSTETSSPAELEVQPASHMKRFLYGGILILLVAFAAILFLGKDEAELLPAPAPTQESKLETNAPYVAEMPKQVVPEDVDKTEPEQPAQPVAPHPDKETTPPAQPGVKPHAESKPRIESRAQSIPSNDKSKTGVLVFAVSPWGEIYLDGEKAGIAPPLRELKVTPGKHTIEIRNEDMKPYTLTLDVAADANMKIKHKFK
jgi:serine/threonine protein kinase